MAHDIVVNEPQRTATELEKTFHRMKKVGFFDEKHGLWKSHLHSSKEDSFQYFDQLLSVYAQTFFDPQGAQQFLTRLENEDLIKTDAHISNVQQVYTSGKFLQILVYDRLGKDANRLFYAFQESRRMYPNDSYDASTYLWFENGGQRGICYLHTQLFAVLVDCKLNPQNARAHFTHLADVFVKDGEWFSEFHESAGLYNSRMSTFTALLKTLVQAQFDRTQAMHEFHTLQKKHYNEKKHAWEPSFTDEQFMGMLLEHELGFETITQPTRPLPILRNF